MKELKLNLGCGTDIKKGFVNIDKYEHLPGVTNCDLNLSLPYSNNSVDYIHCEHLLYYLDNPADFLRDLYRICKPKAKVKLIVTHFSLPMAYAELRTRKSGYSYYSFGHESFNKEFYYKFKVLNKRINFTRINYKWLNIFFNPLINLCPTIYERFFCYILPASEIIFDLEVTK